MMSEIICYICENETQAGDSLKCGGMCNRRMHAKCVSINKHALKAYMELDNLFYMCDTCINGSLKAINNKLDKIMIVITIYDERVKRNEKDMTELKESVAELKLCVNKNDDVTDSLINVNKQCNPLKKLSYADKLKQNEPVVVVVPRQQQTTQLTQKAVMDSMDPTEIPIEKMRNAANGTIILEGRNKDDLDIIHKYAAEKLGTTYDVKLSEMRKPMIVINGMNEKLTGEEIVSKIKKQNKSMENAEFRVVSIYGKKTFSAVIEMNGDDFIKIMSNERRKLNVGWSCCQVKEYVNLLTCYKCQGFHHKAKDCKAERACKKCSGSHDISKCESKATMCINCVQVNKKLNLNLKTNHIAGSKACKVMERKVNLSKKKVQYNSVNI